MKKSERTGAIELVKHAVRTGISRADMVRMLNAVGFAPSPGRKWDLKSIANFICYWKQYFPELETAPVLEPRRGSMQNPWTVDDLVKPDEDQLPLTEISYVHKVELAEINGDESKKDELHRRPTELIPNNNARNTDDVLRIVDQIVQLNLSAEQKRTAINALTG